MLYVFIGFTYIILYFDVCLLDKTANRNGKLEDYEANILCKFQPNGFDCDNKGLTPSRYYYDTQMEDCLTFNFGQCKNIHVNNFGTKTDCNDRCRDVGTHEVKKNVSANIFCHFQPDFGDCHSYHPMWYFDVTERICKGFSYSGCGGNFNRFSTSQQCTTSCAGAVYY